MVGYEREVAVTLAPGDLVDRDLKQRIETITIELLGANALDDPPHGRPVDPHQPTGRRLIGLGRQPRHQVVEVAGEPGQRPRERNRLDADPVLRAAQPSQPAADHQPPHPEIQMPPTGVVIQRVLAMQSREGAFRTGQPPTTQRDRHQHPIGLELDPPDPYPGQTQQARECGTDAHGNNLQFGPSTSPNLRSEPVRVSHRPRNQR